MGLPDDKRRRNPADRFRTILSADKEPEGEPETKKPAVVNLPRLAQARPEASAPYGYSESSGQERDATLHGGFFSAFWTIACLVSLAANAFLLISLFALRQDLRSAGTSGPSGDVLAGVYSGFEHIDAAHIKTTVPIRSEIPLNVTVPLQTTTRITLAEDTVIDGAHVKIASEQFNIDAPANVTLPAGTSLNVALDLQLPVQTTVPIALDVPLDIVVQDTDLHPAILGMQQAIKPALCLASPQALSITGERICR